MSAMHGRLVGDAFDRDGDLMVCGSWMDRAAVTALRDHLSAVLGDAPKPAEVVLEVGREYRLLPGARRANGYADAFDGGGVTRVWLADPEDDDGDVRVEALDGRARGDCTYVLPRYLAPLDAPKPAADVAQAAREVAEMYRAGRSPYPGPQLDSTYAHLGEAFATFADKLEGEEAP